MSERIYILIPRTVDGKEKKLCMTCGRMAAHAAHAAAVLTRASGIDVADKDLIVLSVASSLELENAKYAMIQAGIDFLEYRDTDKAFEGELLTAVITYPLEMHQRRTLKHFRPWCCACNQVPGSSEKEQSAYNREVAGSIPAPEANSDVVPHS